MGRKDSGQRTQCGRHTDQGRRGTALVAATLLALAAVLLFAVAAPAGIDTGEPCWQFLFDRPDGGDAATDVVITTVGTFVAGQMTNAAGDLDASLVRIVGDTPTAARYMWDSADHRNDAAYDIAAKGSSLYTSGASRNAANNLDMLVVRWTSFGGVTWAKRYNGTAKKDDIATDIAVDTKGNVLVCGTSEGAAMQDWVVRKYSPNGKVLWTWKHDGPAHGNDSPVEMMVDGSANVYVAGTTTLGELQTGAYTVKLSPAGKKLWAKKYAGPSNALTMGSALTRCPSGGVYVGGQTWVVGKNYDAFLLRYTATGGRAVFELYDGGGGNVAQRLNDIAVAANGDIIGAGEDTLPTSGGTTDNAWIQWDPAGAIVGGEAHDSGIDDYWTAVATDAFGGVYLTGRRVALGDDPGVWTRRLSVFPKGDAWGYNWYGAGGTQRDVAAIAVRGTTVAVVGKFASVRGDTDQFVQIWRY